MSPERGSIGVVPSPDRKSVTVTAYAPRDGANRCTSASNLNYPMTAEEFARFTDSCVMVRAGLELPRK